MSLTLDLAQSTPTLPTTRHDLVGLDPAEIAARFTQTGLGEKEARMRAKQLWNWIYVNGVTDFEAMTNIAKPMRATLGDGFVISRPEIVSEQVSSDGTRKWLFRFREADKPTAPPVDVETVYIPEEDRGTLCVSSQVGCTPHLLVLPHRHPAAGAQSDRRRDHQPGSCRPRPSRRFSRRQPAR